MNFARLMWTRFEPIHAVTYFTPEALAAYESVGLRGYWRGYFAGRVAPVGVVGASTVVATFFGFAPRMVERAIPDVFNRASPAETLTARRAGATAALQRMLADLDLSAVDEMADLAEAAAERLDPAGHVIGAANLALPHDPDAPALTRLWQATTTLREHRGDGHVAALVAHGFDGCESVVWRCRPEFRGDMQQYRGWNEEEWDAATERLPKRGWLASDGSPTAGGNAAYAAVEDATDRSAGAVWEALGMDRSERLRDLLKPLATATFSAVPMANPMNLPAPA